MTMHAWQRGNRQLDELHEWDENPRRIDPQQLEHLKTSLRDAPDMLDARPLIALPDGRVIAGNQRLVAARELGLTVLPVFTVDLDEKTAREWAIRDNNPYGAWLDDQLGWMLEQMKEAGTDIEALGFPQGELDRLLAAAAGEGGGEGDDTAPGEPPAIPTTQPGDLIVMGEHRLLCGDSHDPLHLDRVFDGVQIGCVLTDPPYGINLDTDWTDVGGSNKALLKGTPGGKYRPVAGDDQPFDAALLVATFAAVREQFWFGANYYRRTLSDSDLDGSWLVWDKRNENADAGFGSGFELCWSRTPHKQDLLRHYFFGAFGAEARDRVHPTQKPTPLLAEILDRWAPDGCAVADPFLGSGSTLIACENTGRACHGLELDPGYCDVIVDRWERHTGKTAERPS